MADHHALRLTRRIAAAQQVKQTFDTPQADRAEARKRVANEILDIDKMQPPGREPAPRTHPLSAFAATDRS